MSANGTIEIEKAKGLEPENRARIAVENAAASVAASDPLPGPAAKAFPLPDVRLGPFTIRAPRAYDWAIQKAMDGPLHRMIQDLSNPLNEQKEVEFTDEESWMICWQFTRPAKDVDAAYCKGGRAAVLQAAKQEFGFEYDGLQIREVLNAVVKQMKETLETALAYTQEKEGDGEQKSFFRDLKT